jgi:Porphyromonas-type peptidyl-arginine deiminase
MNTFLKSNLLQWPLGIMLGIACALVAMPFLGGAPKAAPRSTVGALQSDCDGAIEDLVVHYTPDSAHIVSVPYRDFFRALPLLTVHVVVRRQADFEELRAFVGATTCKLNPVVVDHEITSWSRDRWLALSPAGGASAVTILSPKGELGSDVWPQRKGDESAGESLAKALAPSAVAVRSELFFDGGDFVADDETVFVTPNVRRRNIQLTVEDEAELKRRLVKILGRKVVLLDTPLDHHAGMYMMAVGNRTVLVGDPRAARDALTPEQAAALPLKGGPDFSEATQAAFDAVAEQCKREGYKVVRIPLGPGKDGRTYLTYLNAILDQRDGKRVVYAPTFDGAEALNAAAAKVWQSVGYEVRAVNCTSSFKYFGSLRCLVSVLRRGA